MKYLDESCDALWKELRCRGCTNSVANRIVDDYRIGYQDLFANAVIKGLRTLPNSRPQIIDYLSSAA